jgi:AraC-like DNA-binding protein
MMTKAQVREAVERFIADPNRTMSERLLCELAGISRDTFRDVFKHKIQGLTPMVQLRMERALTALEKGDVTIFQKKDRSRYISYRKEAKLPLKPSVGLTVKNGQIGLKIGPRNVNCYTSPTLKEQLEG